MLPFLSTGRVVNNGEVDDNEYRNPRRLLPWYIAVLTVALSGGAAVAGNWTVAGGVFVHGVWNLKGILLPARAPSS